MEKDEIIEMARQAGFSDADDVGVWITDGYWTKELEAFAKLVAEKEREACAKICERTKADVITGNAVEAFNYATKYLANLIRARGQA
jgi:hypothetical protein